MTFCDLWERWMKLRHEFIWCDHEFVQQTYLDQMAEIERLVKLQHWGNLERMIRHYTPPQSHPPDKND